MSERVWVRPGRPSRGRARVLPAGLEQPHRDQDARGGGPLRHRASLHHPQAVAQDEPDLLLPRPAPVPAAPSAKGGSSNARQRLLREQQTIRSLQGLFVGSLIGANIQGKVALESSLAEAPRHLGELPPGRPAQADECTIPTYPSVLGQTWLGVFNLQGSTTRARRVHASQVPGARYLSASNMHSKCSFILCEHAPWRDQSLGQRRC